MTTQTTDMNAVLTTIADASKFLEEAAKAEAETFVAYRLAPAGRDQTAKLRWERAAALLNDARQHHANVTTLVVADLEAAIRKAQASRS